MNARIFGALLLVCMAACAQAQVEIGKNTIVSFASVEEAKEILTTRDDFVRRMSAFDRSSRMKTDMEVSEEEFLEFLGVNVLEWNETEKQMITSAIQGIQEELDALALRLPEKVLMIKTTGREEGGAAYTRANAIVFPKDQLRAPVKVIQKTICHELFHIHSRANPELSERLYAAIGFVKCDEPALPPELEKRRITNPDAPRNDHCIRIQVEGRDHWAIPILLSKFEKYDTERGGEFFDYLQFQFLLVERESESTGVKPNRDGQNPRFVSIEEVSGFFEQVGRNTDYIIHPEEILADNFALLVLRERNLPTPEIVKRIERILNETRTVEP